MQGVMMAAWLGLAAFAQAPTDEFVPYNDGRLGGCYKTPAGKLYSCTRAAKRIDETVLAPDAPAADADAALSEGDAREELRRVRIELEELKRRQAADDARRAKEERERRAVDDVAAAAERRDEDAAMAAYNAIEAAKDSQNLKRLQDKTETCRAKLEAKGYVVMGPGACKSPSGVYENCPDC